MPNRALIKDGTIDIAEPLGKLMNRPVITVGLKVKFDEVVQCLERFEIHHVVVVNADNIPQGIISYNDLMRYKKWTAATGTSLVETPAEALMSEQLFTLSGEHSLLDAATALNQHRFHCLPIVDADDKLLGVVTAHDLIRFAYSGS